LDSIVEKLYANIKKFIKVFPIVQESYIYVIVNPSLKKMSTKLLYDEDPFTKDSKIRPTKNLASRLARKLSKKNSS